MEKENIVDSKELEAQAERFLTEWRKVPDWDRYPLPEIFYTKFGVPRPKVNSDLMPALTRQLNPPLHEFLGEEVRDKAPGGVREIVVEEVKTEVTFEERPMSIPLLSEMPEMPKLQFGNVKPLGLETKSSTNVSETTADGGLIPQ